MKNALFILRATFGLVPDPLRPRLYWLFPLMVLAALLEMTGLALILPLVNAIAGDSGAGSMPEIARAVALLNDMMPGYAIIALAGAIAAFYLVKNTILFLTVYAENNLIMSSAAMTAANLMRTYLQAPYPFHLRHNSAELIRNLTLAVDDTFRSALKSILRIMLDGLIVAGTFSVMVLADPQITLSIGAGLVVFLGLLFLLTHRKITAWGRRLLVLHKALFQAQAESLGLVREISILGRVEFFTKAYERLRSEASRIHVLHQSISELPRLSIETLLVAAFVAALILVSLRGQDLRDILPLLALYAVAGFRLVPSFNRIVLYANTVRFSAPALRQVAQHYQELRTVRSLPSQTSNPLTIPFGTDLVLENVSFRYEGAEHDALTEISLRVKKGHSVGLVGASGSGKTTIANIMLGLLKPEKGRMLLDGQDVLANLANWQRRIGFIPQDVLILDNSLRHNIALGVEDKDVDDEALREAIRLSRLEGVAASLPDGLDTPLGEKGSRLSGGQRQRIGIARSLYHQPAVLIMDEATSALDNETEREIALSLAAMRGRITMIIVAHRLSTVRHCDMLVFIKAGRVIDAGTFDELNKRNSDFRRMVELGTLDSNPDAAP